MAVIWEMPSDKSGLTFEFVGIGAGGGGGGGGGAGVGGSGGGEGWGVCRLSILIEDCITSIVAAELADFDLSVAFFISSACILDFAMSVM